jgi:hypothetical protein
VIAAALVTSGRKPRRAKFLAGPAPHRWIAFRGEVGEVTLPSPYAPRRGE